MTKKGVRIKIKSIQTDLMAFYHRSQKVGLEQACEEAEDAVVEYATDAVICERDNSIELSYDESVDMGMPNTSTCLVFPKNDPNYLSMIRTGENKASFVFSDKEKRHRCAYNVGGMAFDLCISTRSIDNRITMDGGTLELDYIVEIQGTKTQRNRFSLRVDELKG